MVRDAVLLGLDLAKASMPAVGAMVPERLSEAPRPDPDAVSRATSVTNRMLAYVAAAAT